MVTVVKAENLPPRKGGECIDPFVDIQLLPYYKRKNHSEVHQKTLNPIFNQTFEFEVPPYEIRGQQIQFTVLDFSQQLNHNTIGTVLYDLTLLDSDALRASKEFVLWQRIVKVLSYFLYFFHLFFRASIFAVNFCCHYVIRVSNRSSSVTSSRFRLIRFDL